jgi:hypothetical protein
MFEDARVLALALLSGLSLLDGDADNVSPARLGDALLTRLDR